jgi:hypothetical protein
VAPLGSGLGSDIELKPVLAVGAKGAQTRKGSALSAADALQDIVQDTVELVGRGGGADVGLLRQPSGELFLPHSNQRIRDRSGATAASQFLEGT